MADSFKQTGRFLTLTAPYARSSSGLGALIGAIFGVTTNPVENGAQGVFDTEGVHEIAKTSAQAYTQGQRLFWDNTNKRVDSDPTVGQFIGVASAAAANPSSAADVKLCPPQVMLEGAQATIAAVATADADGTYGAPEASLINELKTTVNLMRTAMINAGLIAAA